MEVWGLDFEIWALDLEVWGMGVSKFGEFKSSHARLGFTVRGLMFDFCWAGVRGVGLGLIVLGVRDLKFRAVA